MTQLSTNVPAQQVKLSVYQLDSLTAHPLITAKCAAYLSDGQYENAAVCIAAEPAIALAVIKFCKQQNTPADLPSPLKQLSKKELIETLLRLDIYDPENTEILSLINPLVSKNGTRAYTAKLIAEKVSIDDKTEVFNAAVFAEAGLFALAQLFTKSLSMIMQESIERNTPLGNLLQENLGVTDNVLSQMLLQKWELGDCVADTGWLFKSNATALIDRLPSGKIISIVRMADMLCESQESGDFQNIVQKLSLADSDVTEIQGKIRIFSEQINAILGLDAEEPSQLYCETVKQIYLNQLAAKTETGEEFEGFVREFIDNIKPHSRLSDIAAISAKAICKIFSVQNVCVFIALPKTLLSLSRLRRRLRTGRLLQALNTKSFLTAVIKDGGDVKTEITENPPDVQSNAPLFIKSDNVLDRKQLALISDFLAKMISIVSRNEEQETIAQTAVECVNPAIVMAGLTETPKNSPMEMVAEIAAGAAHELNNPLAVISGRAQLLSQSETDEAKKSVLNQISEKAKDIHEIVGALMNYARPAKAQIRPVSPFIVLNNALEKVNARYLSEPLDVKLENIETLGDVEADGEQAAEAIAQIIYNALESYESGNGQVRIIGKEQADSVEIRIVDTGCGMSEETLQKATQPFFSDKTAGRQRGMGLAIAESYLKNNNGTMKIESKLEKGTTVIINLSKAG